MSDGWVDRDKTSNVALHAAVQIKQNEDVTWTISTDYGDRSPSRYFGTPLINGSSTEALRFKNYNVGDSNIRYQDSQSQVKTEWQVADGITVHNTLYYLNSQRHWRDVGGLRLQSPRPALSTAATATTSRSSTTRQQIGDRMDATFRGHVFGMVNEFVAGFDVNNISFTHTNNSPYAGPTPAVSLPLYDFDPGVFSSPIATVPSFSSIANQYAFSPRTGCR